ncbi:TetR family transcriptional regulator [Pigmentiphaga sp. NML080357]|uniref:TetR/AcrR family transcriptional regulator n=1 Tax=Pigmentiphaga sp. NML080357 TaxID=2008675 RepID=UPI000B41228F|nr:TetR/AcrR family transcriptional regulator [Pigmentiphaga sp. NML080357]OVZ59404.1 TetR family transcriptional regulator [Pigmentiphaga sp. NML080357]
MESPSPETGRRERKRHHTMDHLAATAFRLFEAHGYDAVTMESVASHADVAKGTLYNHFPVKEALLAHQFHAELAAGLEALREAIAAQSGFAARLRYLLAASAQWCEGRRDYLPHYLQFRLAGPDAAARYRGDRGASSGIDRAFGALIRSGLEDGSLRPGQDADRLTAFLQHLHLGALMHWLATPGLDLRAEFDAMVDFFLAGASSGGADAARRRGNGQ